MLANYVSFMHDNDVVCRTLKMAWEVLKLQADKAATEHLAASQAIMQASQRLQDMMEAQKMQKKQVLIHVIR